MTTSNQQEFAGSHHEANSIGLKIESTTRKKKRTSKNRTKSTIQNIQFWANVNAASVKSCYVKWNQHVTEVFVTSQVVEFDENLNASLSEFLIQMNRCDIPIDGFLIMDGTPEELTAHFKINDVVKLQPIGGV